VGARRDPIDWFVRRAGLARFCTVACALGLSLAALSGPAAVVGVTGLTLSLGGLIAGSMSRRSRLGHLLLVPSVLLSGLFGGLLLGSIRVAELAGGTLQTRLSETTRFELVVTGAVRAAGGWQSAVAEVKCAGAQRVALKEKVWLEVPPDDRGTRRTPPTGESASAEVGFRLEQGMIISCKATAEAPEGESDSGYNQKRQLLHQGIEVVLTVGAPGSLTVLGRRGGFAGAFDRLRQSAREHLSLGPDPRINEVLQGVVMGDTVGIDEGWMEAFRRSGTAHMLSVGGMHVASLAAIIFGLARLLRAPRWTGFALAAVTALLMIPFVGPSPPVTRSVVMIVVVLVGRWVGRARDQWQILALAAVIILVMNPFAVFDVGFQLSFAALVGIMALMAPLQRPLRRLAPSLSANIAVSLAACAGTAPVALAQFGRTSLISPLANLFVVPTLPMVTGLGMASVFAGFIWHGLSVALDTLASLPMMWTVLVSRLMAAAPVLESGDLGRALFVIATGAAVLPAALAVTGRLVRVPLGLPLPFFDRSLRWLRRHRPHRRRRALAAAAALVVCGAALGLAAYPAGQHGLQALQAAVGGRSWPDCVEVRVLDVGQGNAVLVRTPEGHALLFDGGPKDCDLAGELRSLGVRRLDAAVISHPHADHFAGLLQALDDVEVATLVDNIQVSAGAERSPPVRSDASAAQEYLELRSLVRKRGCRYVFAGNGEAITVDGAVVRCFTPAKPLVLLDGDQPWGAMGGAPTGDELNASSLVAMVSVGTVDVLLPGDAEADVLQGYRLPDVEVVVVPHHGSRGALSAELIKRLGARAAIVSVGRDNPFGHPDPSTLALLAQAVGTIVRTDTAGWVSCRLKGEQLTITTERTPTR
jgi:competence protein ComEC